MEWEIGNEEVAVVVEKRNGDDAATFSLSVGLLLAFKHSPRSPSVNSASTSKPPPTLKNARQATQDPLSTYGLSTYLHPSKFIPLFYMDETIALDRREQDGHVLHFEREPFIYKLPLETLFHIFAFLLPNSNAEAHLPLTDEASVDGFFKTMAPYNISRVCRSWRNIVVTNGAFWSEFTLKFHDPSSRVVKKAKSFVLLHLERSQSLPLSCTISLTRTFDDGASNEIAGIMVQHQRRWRKMQLWFDFQDSPCALGCVRDERRFKEASEQDKPACSETLFCPRVRRFPYDVKPKGDTKLWSRDMSLLEELSINQVSLYQYRGDSKAEYAGELAPMMSVHLLDLEMPERYDKVALWLQLIPNIKEFRLAFHSSDPRWYRRPNDFRVQPLHLDNLQILTVDRCVSREWDSGQLASAAKASAFVVRYLTCPSLTQLSVRLAGDDAIHHLRDFFHRSAPSLNYLDLHILDRPSNGEAGQVILLDRVIASLQLLSSITSLRLASRSIDSVDRLLEELRSTTLLPSLEEIEFDFA
ncbi:hypothetical protein SCHPADRAFT_943589 [Schizopora paradoxa]|uniref:F-box domain-containing protein n=1 Tax=Schizopora paradoxa TaxID=27342 RepID=A0A0H2RXQ5_9AGAM|nr:hypothetical protein SCHPADRAFT_943589 [Schizopora paradoxa]